MYGTLSALVTPFIEGRLDLLGLETHIVRQCAAGVGIVLLGTTGEGPTVTDAERSLLLQKASQTLQGRVPLLVATGCHSTQTTIERTLQAAAHGASGVLVVSPYYNRPTQEGLRQHFTAVAEASPLPLLLYNSPSRTGVHLELSTVCKLAEISNIVGIKEASGNLFHVAELLAALRRARPDFAVLSGDDALTLPMMALGAQGVISVASNLVPERVSALVQAAAQERLQEARTLHEALMPLFKALTLEVNPIPIKAALALAGLPGGECRLPLSRLQEVHRLRLAEVLQEVLS